MRNYEVLEASGDSPNKGEVIPLHDAWELELASQKRQYHFLLIPHRT
jgi:hypothetical protein